MRLGSREELHPLRKGRRGGALVHLGHDHIEDSRNRTVRKGGLSIVTDAR
jgi:hypothetical protein